MLLHFTSKNYFFIHISVFRESCWKKKYLLVLVGETTGGGFEILRGYKTHCFISIIKSLQRLNKSFEYTPSLFLSSVSFFSFPR